MRCATPYATPLLHVHRSSFVLPQKSVLPQMTIGGVERWSCSLFFRCKAGRPERSAGPDQLKREDDCSVWKIVWSSPVCQWTNQSFSVAFDRIDDVFTIRIQYPNFAQLLEAFCEDTFLIPNRQSDLAERINNLVITVLLPSVIWV